MSLIKNIILFFVFLFISCNKKLPTVNQFASEKFIENNKNNSPNELNLKLDSILINNTKLTTNDKAFINFEKGKNHLNSYNDKKAIESFSNAVKLFKDINNIDYTIKSLINLSNTNIYLKNYTIANAQVIEALDLAKEKNIKPTTKRKNILTKM